MNKDEERLRIEVIRRYLHGEAPAKQLFISENNA